MRGLVVSGAVALALAAGCGSTPTPSPEATARTSSPIQGGTSDTTHDFAVGIAIDLGGGEGAICSGALLAPNLVATARHCADQISSDTVDCSSSTFGAAYSPSQYIVTNSAVLSGTGANVGVSKIVTPTASDEDTVCGNDIALLILKENIQLPQYVEPVLTPPMTDHSVWATSVTAIGYGIDTPTDTTGTSAGTRRIRENISLVCIPNDPSFVDCYADPGAKSIIAADEFESGDGTCEGDSGSSAFDQSQFNNGKWVSFGVLSRGGISTDGTTCVGSIYSRFDAWAQLLQDTAVEAAQMGGYTAPAWATESLDAGGSSGGSSSEGGLLGEGATCTANEQCQSQNCVSTNSTNFICASTCSATQPCASGSSCDQGYCFPASPGGKSGCAVAFPQLDPAHPVPWRQVTLVLGLAGLVLVRRRRR